MNQVGRLEKERSVKLQEEQAQIDKFVKENKLILGGIAASLKRMTNIVQMKLVKDELINELPDRDEEMGLINTKDPPVKRPVASR